MNLNAHRIAVNWKVCETCKDEFPYKYEHITKCEDCRREEYRKNKLQQRKQQ
jgi:hypothetical protein